MPDGLIIAVLAVLWLATGAVVGFAVGRRRSQPAEIRLAEAEARSRAILDAAVDGVVTIDEKARIETFNRAAERIFGYTADEVRGHNVSMLMPEPYHSEHDTYMHNYISTGIPRIIGIGRTVEGRRKNGGVFPMDLAVGESRQGGRRIFAGIVRDITDRKRVEESLRASEERFRVLLEGVRDYAIILLDPAGLIVSWNPGAERIYGWRAEEVLGTPTVRFYPVDQAAAGRPSSALETAEREGRSEEEGWRVRKDGGRFWAHVIITALRDATGQLQGFSKISNDLTENKAYEDALRAAKEDAEAERERSERARAEAERANAAKTKFLASASHDLRQPVQAIVFFTSVLADKLRSHPAAKVVQDLDTSVSGLNMLLDSLLDVSKLDAGLVTPKKTTFTVSSILDRTAIEFAPAAAAKGLRLTVVPSSVSVTSDPALLSRIVQNLVSNAVRHTERGQVLLGCRRHRGQLRIEVLDTGPGIPASRRKDIFDEFIQLRNPERDRTQGLGLGLAIVQRLGRLLDHEIGVESEPGKGSVFWVDVPVAVVPARVPAPLRAAPSHAGSRLVVLIDDEPIVLKGLSMVLESWGYRVVAATSEAEAIAKLDGHAECPSLILADYRLREGHTGTEAVANLRGRYNASIPSIIITGDTAPERLREAESSGLSILHKPIRPPALREAVRETLIAAGVTLH